MKNNLKTLIGYLLEETISQQPFDLSIDNLVAHRDALFDAYVHCVYRGKCSKSSGPIVVVETEDGKYQLIDGYHRLIEHLLDRGGASPISAIIGGEGSGEYAIARGGERWVGDAFKRYGNLEDLMGASDKRTLAGHAKKRKNAKSGDFWYHTTSGENTEKKREMIVEGLTAPKNKKLLLLVHPDAVFEMHMDDTNFIKEYMERLRETFTLPTFDYVITHLMFSDVAPEVVSGIRDRKELWDEFKELLNSESDWIGLDRKFSASFSDALPDYLIENEGTEIWLGGGYKNLCVEDTRKQLFMKLNDIIELTGAKVVGCYASLIFTERHRPSFGDSK